MSSIYSGVVSLKGIRLVLFLAELNRLDSWDTDIDNVHLKAKIKEKVYIIASSKFSTLKDHILMNKALHRLYSSSLY